MGFAGVVPDKVIDEGLVERFDVVDDVFIALLELAAEGAVEAFDMSIRLRMPGIGVEVHDGAATDGIDEVLFELEAVIFLNMFYGEQGNASELPNEVGGVLAVEMWVAVSEAKAAVHVDGREQVAFESVTKDGQRVYLHEISGFLGLIAVMSFLRSPGLYAAVDQAPVATDHLEPHASARQAPGCLQVSNDLPTDDSNIVLSTLSRQKRSNSDLIVTLPVPGFRTRYLRMNSISRGSICRCLRCSGARLLGARA